MGDAAQDQFQVSIEVDDSAEAREVEQALAQAGATEVETSGEGIEGALPIAIVVGAIATVAAVADLAERIRRRFMCQQIIDTRDNQVRVSRDCDIRDGRIIVISADDQKVEIHDVPDGLDVTEVLKAALTAGADAVKAVAEKAGATATNPKPADLPAPDSP
jgi:hypothetical protein